MIVETAIMNRILHSDSKELIIGENVMEGEPPKH